MFYLNIIGSLLLMFSNIPQAIKSCMDRHSNGVSLLTILMGIIGFSCILIYIYLAYCDYLLMFNYGFNTIVLFIILYWKIYPCKMKS
jgi:uncharacterized protein with PQ loop repeat